MSEQIWINDKCDRSKWEPGPWDGEPDKVQWKDAATGLDCLAVRHASSGHWCGYVGVPPSHPAHGRGYDDVSFGDVHGGLTFAEACAEADEPCRGICHVAAPGEPEKLWWFGFDCHHSSDLAPRDTDPYCAELFGGRDWNRSYKSLGYVKAECARLAAEIAAPSVA